ncbi:hypothetical protein FQR65_LT01256 [Abscondita terminalis]|nr:hypothetical protein FQR65_LT01256 [Abscondita terminalis]
MSKGSGLSGVPPVGHVKGAGESGIHTKDEGLLSFEEVCILLKDQVLSSSFRKIEDSSGKYGTYAFKPPDKSGNGGMWISYEDPLSAESKVSYARSKGLGGVAIVDLTLDDFRGSCKGSKYPILQAVMLRL